MKRKPSILITTLICIATFALTGCGTIFDKTDTDPQSTIIDVDTTFGETDSEVTINLPKDMKGKSAYLAVHRVDDQLPQGIVQAGQAVKKMAEADMPPTTNSAGSPGDELDPPELSKEFLALEFWIADYEHVNNPEVLAVVAKLKEAVNRDDREAIKQLSEDLTGLLGTTITKLVKP